MPKFSKPPLSIPDLLLKWKSRGLTVEDDSEASLYLEFIGYYRLSAYTLNFQEQHLPDKPFLAGSTFRQILDLYRFDRELRLHALDAIERIEVAVRAVFLNETSALWGSHWYMDRKHFSHTYSHARLIEKIACHQQAIELSQSPGNSVAVRLILSYLFACLIFAK